MKKLYTLLFLVCNYACYAQNYQCLQNGVTHYFTNGNGYLRGIRIDSVRTSGSDTVFYPFKTTRSSTYPLDTSRGSWLGSRVIQQSDGTFLFNTIWNDTVVIKTKANAGDSWTFYNDISATYYVANVLAADTMSILGAVDSIKKISITSYTGGAINTADTINNFQIILSKNNGFVKVFDLYLFPYHNPDTSVHTPLSDMYLDAIGYFSSFNHVFSLVDYHNPTQMEMFNFDIGDAFYTNVQRMETGSGLLTNSNVYDSIVSKTIVDAFHVTYQIYEWRYITDYHPGVTVNNFYTATNPFTADTSVLANFGKMPESIETYDTGYFYKTNDTSHCKTGNYYRFERFPGFEMCPYDFGYKPGFDPVSSATFDDLGGTDYTGCYATTTSRLLFSIKNGVFCGTHPMPPNGVKEITINNHYSLYPNPATDQLTIKTNNTLPYTITLTNMIGQTVMTVHTTRAQETINVRNVPAGVYSVTINDEGGSRYNEKVVVVH